MADGLFFDPTWHGLARDGGGGYRVSYLMDTSLRSVFLVIRLIMSRLQSRLYN